MTNESHKEIQSNPMVYTPTEELFRNIFNNTHDAARIGGDEFAVLIPEADQGIWDKLRRHLVRPGAGGAVHTGFAKA